MAYVLGFGEIDRTQTAIVGGKGANLGELTRIDGVEVPDGFCVSTDAFARTVAGAPSIADRIDELSRLEPHDQEAIRVLSAQIRCAIEELTVPEDVAAEIIGAHTRLGAEGAYAVRSSATAEDLPTASFAGQQDTYLNIVGSAAILEHVSRCWGSLFTERAVTYRLRNGLGDRAIRMAVVVQRMVFPRAAGILVTADPLTSDRTVVSIDAGFGLGEALVSGLVNADVYQVRNNTISSSTIATKKLAVEPAPTGGTQVREITEEQRNEPVLSDAEVLRLAQLGRRIEAHFGSPQDIEWCLDGADIRIVQSRPITTLFPIPVAADEENRVYVSVGHQQMMTDAMKPLGISLWQLTSRAPMRDAGGRLFVDVTTALSSPTTSAGLVAALGESDPLIADALQAVIDHDFVRQVPEEDSAQAPAPQAAPSAIETDPDIVTELIADSEASLTALKQDIRTQSGPALLDFIHADIQELRRVLFTPRGLQVITAAMDASEWLNDRLREWLGEKNAADALTQSVPGNVTSEMGLALLDVADVIRPHPEVVAYLQHAQDGFLDELAEYPGGRETRAAIENFLDRYGMRCAGEIDITRPRWRESPVTLVPTILGNIKNFGPGAGRQRFEKGLRDAAQKKEQLLKRLRALPDGAQKAAETERMIDRVRTFSGYREYPKYGMISRYFVYKQALLREAERLVAAGVLRAPDDIFYLRFDELREVVSSQRASAELIDQRKDEFRAFQALTPPRVLTSDGAALTGAYRRADLPSGALPGMAVSAGTIEGRARVLTDIAQADLAAGDILVTAYTDPSWTPLFVAIKGLVTEVGGLMTHGAVIAREYGLPAVVGVEHATELIRDGQRIRVNGTDGYVEILS
ncbi:rifamycin-inactivating phosphotransferase [Nocardia ninae]|uniref:Rifampicin phosphotransferase n=1 Tax=Nocardia ninae NBRC 108245 TaxID=1210091 RepID=A0A511M5Q2_9NOCA|nr:rifamycin-inactivating phosphotransferase [Nocardia ninae]GEM35962.1 putative phosphoenolpyruvate synthase [Nocardia ninae NBRC 108245]